MSLDIGEAFGEGFSRSIARNALLLTVVFAVVAFLTLVFQQTLNLISLERMLEFYQEMPADQREAAGVTEQDVQALEEQYEFASEYLVLALPIPLSVAAVGFVLVAILAEYASVLAVRVFGTDETGTIPRDLAGRNALLATLNGFIGGIVVWGVVAAGSVLLVVPGVFLAVSLYFVRQEIAIKDKNFVQAMADSWRLTRGNRFRVLGVLVLATAVTNLWYVLTPLFFLIPPFLAGVIVAIAIGYLGVVGAAIVTRAYVQLDAEPAGVDDAGVEEDPYDAALGPDDIPE